MSLASDLRAAYDAAGEVWGDGPTRVYRELARPLLDAAGDVSSLSVLDVGTGTGVLADVLVRRGARVTGVDVSHGMLSWEADRRPPAAAGDARALPFRTASVDAATAAFVLNHLDDPGPAIRELGRVVRGGGRVLATTFEGEAAHPAKAAVDEVVASFGFEAPAWYRALKAHAMPVLSSGDAFASAAERGGLLDVAVDSVPVRLILTDRELVGWRLGMAQHAAFVVTLPADERAALWAQAESAVTGRREPVALSVLLLQGRSAG